MTLYLYSPAEFGRNLLLFVDSDSAYNVLENLSDANLATLCISIWRPRRRPIIREKMCDIKICLKLIFFLKLIGNLMETLRFLQKKKADKMAVYYKNTRKSSLRPAKCRNLHAKC